MRLIDADRIVYSWHIDADGEEHDGVTLQSIIKKMPTVDAVEVVRCENCRYFVTNYAVPHCGRTLIGMKKSDYCSYGERREE